MDVSARTPFSSLKPLTRFEDYAYAMIVRSHITNIYADGVKFFGFTTLSLTYVNSRTYTKHIRIAVAKNAIINKKKLHRKTVVSKLYIRICLYTSVFQVSQALSVAGAAK